MRDSWSNLVGNVLQPARPRLEECLRAREEHVEARRLHGQARAKRIAACEARIEAAREEVFGAQDGIVTSRMTDLEREWRMLSRQDPDNGLMDLWARIVPGPWLDRKRWRDSDRASQLDSAIALASDVNAVDEAERAIDLLRASLSETGTTIGRRTKWRLTDQDYTGTAELLANSVNMAREALSKREGELVVVARAHELEADVSRAVLDRFPDRQVLADAVGRGAFVDHLWRAARLPARDNPATALHALWKTGYVIGTIDARDVILGIPRIPAL